MCRSRSAGQSRWALFAFTFALLIGSCAIEAVPDVSQADTTNQALESALPSNKQTPAVAIRTATTPTATVAPRRPLDDPGATIGLLAELGLGRPGQIWPASDVGGVYVVSPFGLQLLRRTPNGWTLDPGPATYFADTFFPGDRLTFARGGNPDLSMESYWQSWICDLAARPKVIIEENLLAYQDTDWSVQVWDLNSETRISRTEPLEYPVADIEIGAGGSVIAVRQIDQVHLFEVASGEHQGTLVVPNLDGLALSSSTGQAVTASEGLIQLWDLGSRTVSKLWRDSSIRYVSDMVWMTGGSTIIAVQPYSRDLWILGTGDAIQPLELPFSIEVAELSRSGDQLALWGRVLGRPDGEQETFALLDLDDDTLVHSSHKVGQVSSLGFVTEGSLMGVTCHGGILEIDSELREVAEVSGLPFHGPVTDIAFSPGAPLLATASPGWPVRLWDVDSGRMVGEIEPGGHTLAFSADGEMLAVGSLTEVQIWQLGGWSDGDQIAAGMDLDNAAFTTDASILGLRRATLEIVHPTGASFAPEAELLELAFAGDGSLIGLSRAGTLVWDTTDFEQVRSTSFGVSSWEPALSPEADLVVVSYVYTVKSLDVRDPAIGTFLYSIDPPAPRAISPDLREYVTLGSSFGSGLLELRDLRTGEVLRGFEVPISPGSVVAYSTDGSLIAASGRTLCSAGIPREECRRITRSSVLLADPYRREVLAVLQGQTGQVTAMVFSPEGDLLATGASDGTIRLWGVLP